MDENPYAPPQIKSVQTSAAQRAERRKLIAAWICMGCVVSTLLLLGPVNHYIAAWIYHYYKVDQGLMMMQGLFTFAYIIFASIVFIYSVAAYQAADRQTKSN